MKPGDIVVFNKYDTQPLQLGELERYFPSKDEWSVIADYSTGRKLFMIPTSRIQKPLPIGTKVTFNMEENGDFRTVTGKIIGVNNGTEIQYEPHYLVEPIVARKPKMIYLMKPGDIEAGLSDTTRNIHRRMLSRPLGHSKTRSKAVSSLSISSNSSHTKSRKSRSNKKEKQS